MALLDPPKKLTTTSLLNQMAENLNPENQTDAGESFSYILEMIISDTEHRTETLRELVANPTIFRHACYRLLTFGHKGQQTTYQKVLTEQLWSAFRNKDIPLLRLFAIQFIPILVWFHLSRQKAQGLPGVAACLAGLHQYETSQGEEKAPGAWDEEGAGGSYILFPKVDVVNIFQSDSVYHKIGDLNDAVTGRTHAQETASLPAVKSLTSCSSTAICRTALQLYVHFISRVSNASLRKFLLVAGLLCSGWSELRSNRLPDLLEEEELFTSTSKIELEESFVMQLLKGFIFIRERRQLPELTAMLDWALERCFRKAHADVFPLAILTIQSMSS